MTEARTVGELKSSGYKVLPVREEIRRNLIYRLRHSEDVFPGIIGFHDSVIPQIQNAILSGQDLILLGERGQAKSRLVRSLVALLDEYTPVLQGVEIPENPFAPVSVDGRNLIAEKGDAAPIQWLHRDHRYGEKLATPDITIADLIGEVDPIKIAEGRYLADEEALHFGLLPHTNRGIFAINELPDLAERIQVGLLNVMEERDIQIRGHKFRLDLDILVVATANPEDYTNRGRIITPLKDRYGSQIRTHYPQTVVEEITIMEQERRRLDLTEYKQQIPMFMSLIIAEITQQARRSADINQRSGVSVRASVTNYESLMANALRRIIATGEKTAVPRISDLPFIVPSLQGKIEFEAMEDGQEDKIMNKLFTEAIKAVFEQYSDLNEMETVALQFAEGLRVTTGESLPSGQYASIIKRIDGMSGVVGKVIAADNLLAEHSAANGTTPNKITKNPAVRASVVEFILEGLHLNQLLNKDRVGGKTTYRG